MRTRRHGATRPTDTRPPRYLRRTKHADVLAYRHGDMTVRCLPDTADHAKLRSEQAERNALRLRTLNVLADRLAREALARHGTENLPNTNTEK